MKTDFHKRIRTLTRLKKEAEVNSKVVYLFITM